MAEDQAGRLRPLPVLLLQQLIGGPMSFHAVPRPMIGRLDVPVELPDLQESCRVLADDVLRAVATEQGLQARDTPPRNAGGSPPGHP